MVRGYSGHCWHWKNNDCTNGGGAFWQNGKKSAIPMLQFLLISVLKVGTPKENVDYYNVDTFVAEFLQMEAGSVEIVY